MFFTRKRLQLYFAALFVLQLLTCVAYRSAIRAGAVDYRLYYTAGYMLRTGNATLLYDYAAEQRDQSALVTPASTALPFFAPPFAALLFVPLSRLPYLPSLLLFGLINLALLGVIILLMSPHLRSLSNRWPPLPALLFLTFLPIGLTLMMGQLSILILLIDCLAFALLEAGSPFLAGLVLSLALMKFQTAIPIALLFFLWRRWRFTLGFLTGASALLVISAWIIGLRSLIPYLHSITHMSALAGTPLQQAVGVTPQAMANLYGLFFMLAPNNHVATILTVVASLLLVLWAATRRPSLPLALLVAILVSYHFYPCDLTLLLLPVSLLCNRIISEDTSLCTPASQTWRQRHRRQIILCSVGAFLISPLMVEIININLIFLYALPILGLALSPLDWSTLTLPPAPAALATQELATRN